MLQLNKDQIQTEFKRLSYNFNECTTKVASDSDLHEKCHNVSNEKIPDSNFKDGIVINNDKKQDEAFYTYKNMKKCLFFRKLLCCIKFDNDSILKLDSKNNSKSSVKPWNIKEVLGNRYAKNRRNSNNSDNSIMNDYSYTSAKRKPSFDRATKIISNNNSGGRRSSNNSNTSYRKMSTSSC